MLGQIQTTYPIKSSNTLSLPLQNQYIYHLKPWKTFTVRASCSGVMTKDSVPHVQLFSLLIHKCEMWNIRYLNTIFPEGIHSLEHFEKLHMPKALIGYEYFQYILLEGISELQKIDNVFFSNVIKMQKFCISRFFAYYRRMADVRWKQFKYWGKNKCFCIISTIFFLKIIKFSRKAVFSIPKYFLPAYSVYNTPSCLSKARFNTNLSQITSKQSM